SDASLQAAGDGVGLDGVLAVLATLGGRCLGFGRQIGRIEPGHSPARELERLLLILPPTRRELVAGRVLLEGREVGITFGDAGAGLGRGRRGGRGGRGGARPAGPPAPPPLPGRP